MLTIFFYLDVPGEANSEYRDKLPTAIEAYQLAVLRVEFRIKRTHIETRNLGKDSSQEYRKKSEVAFAFHCNNKSLEHSIRHTCDNFEQADPIC